MRRNKLPRPSVKTLPIRIVRSYGALLRLVYFHPFYLFIAAISSIVFYEIIFWFLNLGLFHYLLTTPFLSFGDKLHMLIGSYSGIFMLPLAPLSMTLFAVSVLQGVTIAAIVYTMKKERAMHRDAFKGLGGTGVAGILSVLGLGCVPCGTSLVTPILTFFFATSSVAVAEKVGLYAAIFALIISCITAHLAGTRLRARLDTPRRTRVIRRK